MLGILAVDGFKFLEKFGPLQMHQHVYTELGASLTFKKRKVICLYKESARTAQ